MYSFISILLAHGKHCVASSNFIVIAIEMEPFGILLKYGSMV